MSFYLALAWIFGVMSILLIVLRLIAFTCYSELDKLQDALDGRKATFPIITPSIIAIICFTYILTVKP
jgi:hypothetical protein